MLNTSRATSPFIRHTTTSVTQMSAFQVDPQTQEAYLDRGRINHVLTMRMVSYGNTTLLKYNAIIRNAINGEFKVVEIRGHERLFVVQ